MLIYSLGVVIAVVCVLVALLVHDDLRNNIKEEVEYSDDAMFTITTVVTLLALLSWVTVIIGLIASLIYTTISWILSNWRR